MATAKNCVQWCLEETPRYESATTSSPYQISSDVHYPRIQSLGFVPNRVDIDRSDELSGIEGSLPAIPDTFGPTGSLKMRGYVNSLTWLLTVCGFKGVHAAGDGVITDPDSQTIGTGAHKWTFSKRTGVTAKTMQMLLCYVSEGMFFKAQGVAASQLSFDAAGEISANLSGLVYSTVSDPNITPSYDAGTIYPTKRSDLTLTWLGSSGKTNDFSIAIANPLNPHKDYSVASKFPNLMEQGDDKVAATGKFTTTNLAAADIAALMGGTTFAAKARWLTEVAIGTSTHNYGVYVVMPACQYVDGGVGDIDNKRKFGEDLSFKAQWDEGTSKDVEIVLVNSVTTISSGSPDVGL